MSEIGQNVKRLCGMHLASQEHLARVVAMSKQGLNNIVVGRSQPGIATAQKIAAAFGVTIDELAADEIRCVQAGAANMDRAPIAEFLRASEEPPHGLAKRIQSAQKAS